MMMLAASPGGTTANLYSHLFRGDIALNISLTAVNSVIAVVTLPLITNFAIAYFDPFDDQLGLQWAKALEVFAIVLLPVALGMVVRRFWPTLRRRHGQARAHRSVIILDRRDRRCGRVELGAAARELRPTSPSSRSCSASSASRSATSCPAVLKVGKRQAIATSFEIGIHNATLAIVIAQTVLGSVELSLPAAVYGVLMFFIAFGFGFLIRERQGCRRLRRCARRTRRQRASA